ncbi:MAG: PAS domain S-box protein [Gemmatimonadaceae bacterium]
MSRTTRPRSFYLALLLLLVVVGGGVTFRVRYLRRQMLSRWQEALRGGAVTTEATVNEWYAERGADADALASSVALHAQAGAGPGSFKDLLAPIARRGKFVAVWIVDSTGRVLTQSTNAALEPQERNVFREAIASRKLARSEIMVRGEHAGFLTLAQPVIYRDPVRSAMRPAAVVMRTDVVAAFTPWVSGRPNAAMSLFSTPAADGAILVFACPEQRVPVCMRRITDLRRDVPASLALSGEERFGRFDSFEGVPLLAVTRYDSILGWGVVRRVAYRDAVVPLRTELAIEGAFLAVLLALGGVAAYAANRTMRVRRLYVQREAAERLSVVVDASTDGIVSFDDKFVITMVNGAIERLLGYSRQALIGQPVFTLFAEQWHAPLAESLQAFASSSVARAPAVDTERCIARCADGRLIPVDARVARAVLADEALFVMGLRDMSERARTEVFAQGQRHVLELIASGAPPAETMSVLLTVLEGEARLMRCAIYEVDEERQVAKIVSGPALPSEFLERIREVALDRDDTVVGMSLTRGETVFSLDAQSHPQWRESLAFASSFGIRGSWSIPLRAADGHVIGALVGYHDVARRPTSRERELARAAVHLASIALSSARDAASLRSSEASFRSFVENAPAAIFRETRRGVLVSSNPAMVTLLGYGDAGALARAADRCHLYQDPDARGQLLRELEAHDVVRGHEVEWRRADGSLVTVRMNARAYRDDAGAVWLWEGFAEDVTSLRATEVALRQSERLAAVGQLISGVAHELNNPLSSIMAFAEDLLSDQRSSADEEALGVIRDQARRSRAIVRDLLSFVRQRKTTAAALSLGDVVAATARAMRLSLESAGVSVHLIQESSTGAVLADRAGIEQIVTNLVGNAAQAAGRGGQVWVRTDEADGSCRLIVEDSGPGIPEDVLPRVFDPFFTTKPTGEGTGLGLSVTLGIVEQFGGRINVEPRVAGQGARFTVYLPSLESTRIMADETTTRASETTAPPAAAAPGHVALVIDDEPTIRAALRRYFTRRGWAVEEASDGQAGLALLVEQEDRIGVVVSDLRMPGFSGIDLHDQLLRERPALLRRFIFSTGDVASLEAASFVQRTHCPVLQKPFELRQLDEILTELTEGTTAERAVT